MRTEVSAKFDPSVFWRFKEVIENSASRMK
jgi:hypothetical protein